MLKLICQQCGKLITMHADTDAATLPCPYCGHEVDLADGHASRWFVAHQAKQYGPYTWRRLVALALRGDLDPDVMLFKERSDRWVRAGTLQALFAKTPYANTASAVDAPAVPQTAVRRQAAAPPPAPLAVESAAAPVAAEELQALLAYINALDATLKPAAAEPPRDPEPALSPTTTGAITWQLAPSWDTPAVPAPPAEVALMRDMPEPAPEAFAPPAVAAPVVHDVPVPATPAPARMTPLRPAWNILLGLVRRAASLRLPSPRWAERRCGCCEQCGWRERHHPPRSRHASPSAPAASLERHERRPIPWLFEGAVAASLSVLIAACIILGFFVVDWGTLRGPAARPSSGMIEQTTPKQSPSAVSESADPNAAPAELTNAASTQPLPGER